VIQENEDKLKKVFIYYCQFGDTLNTESLKSMQFVKMLKDMNIISRRGLSTVDADLIFKKIGGLNSVKVAYHKRNIAERQQS
jgi:hypothetical protein